MSPDKNIQVKFSKLVWLGPQVEPDRRGWPAHSPGLATLYHMRLASAQETDRPQAAPAAEADTLTPDKAKHRLAFQPRFAQQARIT